MYRTSERVSEIGTHITSQATGAKEFAKRGIRGISGIRGIRDIRGIGSGAKDAGQYVAEGLYKTGKTALQATAETTYLFEDIGLDTMETNTFKRTSDYLKKIPTFYKLLFLLLFYLFFYKIFYDIGRYIGLNSLELILYMFWFGILILLLAFLIPSRSRLYS